MKAIEEAAIIGNISRELNFRFELEENTLREITRKFRTAKKTATFCFNMHMLLNAVGKDQQQDITEKIAEFTKQAENNCVITHLLKLLHQGEEYYRKYEEADLEKLEIILEGIEDSNLSEVKEKVTYMIKLHTLQKLIKETDFSKFSRNSDYDLEQQCGNLRAIAISFYELKDSDQTNIIEEYKPTLKDIEISDTNISKINQKGPEDIKALKGLYKLINDPSKNCCTNLAKTIIPEELILDLKLSDNTYQNLVQKFLNEENVTAIFCFNMYNLLVFSVGEEQNQIKEKIARFTKQSTNNCVITHLLKLLHQDKKCSRKPQADDLKRLKDILEKIKVSNLIEVKQKVENLIDFYNSQNLPKDLSKKTNATTIVEAKSNNYAKTFFTACYFILFTASAAASLVLGIRMQNPFSSNLFIAGITSLATLTLIGFIRAIQLNTCNKITKQSEATTVSDYKPGSNLSY